MIPDSGAVTGREYHCPLRFSLHELQGPPAFTAGCFNARLMWVLAHPLTVLTLIATPEGKYLMNVYPLVVLRGSIFPLTYSHGRGQKTTFFEKILEKVQKNMVLTLRAPYFKSLSAFDISLALVVLCHHP